MSHSGHGASESNPKWLRWLLAAMIVGTVFFGYWGTWEVELKEMFLPPAAPSGVSKIEPAKDQIGNAEQAEEEQAEEEQAKESHAHQDHAKAEHGKKVHPPDPLSVFYHSCQLLVAHGGHVHGVVPWKLHVGRFLGLGSIFLAGGLAYFKFFRDESNAISILVPWRRPHLVICGLGEVGLRLALGARDKGEFVVAVEKDAHERIKEARRRGIVVIEGDASSFQTLKKTRILRAARLIACTNDDATNVEIVAMCKQLTTDRKAQHALACRLMLSDDKLRQSLINHKVFDNSKSGKDAPKLQVQLGDLHLGEIAARQITRRFPLDFRRIQENDSTVVHLVVVGAGPVAKNLALHAIRHGIFANCGEKRLKLTFVNKDGEAEKTSFCKSYPMVSNFCDVGFQNIDFDNVPSPHDVKDWKKIRPQGISELAKLSCEPNELVTYAFCYSNNDRTVEIAPWMQGTEFANLLLGMMLGEMQSESEFQTLVYQSKEDGLVSLLSDPRVKPLKSQNIHVFGMKGDIINWNVLFEATEDRIARALHEDYASRHGAWPWDSLPENFKDSNRHAADHIPVKLRAIGCYADVLMRDKERVESFNDEERMLMAQMEHHRWCIERWLDGWKHGSATDRSKKISQDLVPWRQLSQKEQTKDFEQIDAIPRILLQEGKGIYRT